ncbi:MAG: hypothetical protein QXP56_07680 [Archaeoglobaceae archaeon]
MKALTQIKYSDLGYSAETDFDNFISDLINYASALVDDYCGQSFTEQIPPAVSYATALIVTNMLHEILQRKINPTVTSTEVAVKIVEHEAFTDDLKMLLNKYRKIGVHIG